MNNLIKNLQLGLLVIILLSTIIAVFIEMNNMYHSKSVTLADLLLMFLYLEVLAMVRVFWDEQSIRITLPLLIAITALSRFIIMQGKEIDPSALVYQSAAILLIAIAIVVMRLRHSKKLGIEAKNKNTTIGFVRFNNKGEVEYIFVNPLFRKKNLAKKLLILVKKKTGKKIVFQEPISPLGSKLLKSIERWN